MWGRRLFLRSLPNAKRGGTSCGASAWSLSAKRRTTRRRLRFWAVDGASAAHSSTVADRTSVSPRDVAKERGDGLQRGPGAQQVRGGRVPEQMGPLAGRLDASASERVSDDSGDGGRASEGSDRCVVTQEEPRAVRDLAYRDVGQERIAHLLRKRKSHLSPTLAEHTQGPALPVDVVQGQRDDVASAETEPGKEEEYRPVSQPAAGVACTGSEDGSSLSLSR